ncbi:polyphosphate kinase 2 family protein [Acetobacteraceae bacterium KSS8]|uniref:Polyphosphate kinase 2 family protein n=1 Tax=Endosaccharibacter trunci TaxID=2812733 RepID=A0ABT1W3Y2_9PROT|nr:polyphosphate kinase 2 family protein [Acetobacteraceae bacterium KSS8]
MKHKERKALLKRFRVTDGAEFSLADHDPDAAPGGDLDKDEGKALLEEGTARLAELQAQLYADGRHGLLAVFQAMDAGGKDGTIKHVMSGVNPQGVTVTAFKQPSVAERSRDFLWRVHQAAPPRGHIGIHNRSHYEEVLVTRVHPELLDGQSLPDERRGHGFWHDRFKDIRHFERYLDRQGIRTVKFFLHISKEEQRQRFLARLEERDKNWKFSEADLKERGFWNDYQDAYQAAIRGTATARAPWYVVPGNRKWFARLVVVEALIDALEQFGLEAPKPVLDEAGLDAARRQLEAEA